jgi:glycerol dehydrogenase
MSISLPSLPSFTLAPAQIVRGSGIVSQLSSAIARLGQRPLIVGGDQTLAIVKTSLRSSLEQAGLQVAQTSYAPDCCETSLARLHQAVSDHHADVILGVGGGKAMDTAKLLAYQSTLPIVTVPTSGATCAA